MFKHSIPYQRKVLYLLITFPVIIVDVLIGIYLNSLNTVFLIIYLMFIFVTVLLQSYNCIYWECPHVGRLCPGAGGICVFSSLFAELLIKFNVKRSRNLYNILCTIATISALGYILYPVYFIAKPGLLYVFLYLGIMILYGVGMMFLICPLCGAKEQCPGGRTSTKLNGCK